MSAVNFTATCNVGWRKVKPLFSIFQIKNLGEKYFQKFSKIFSIRKVK